MDAKSSFVLEQDLSYFKLLIEDLSESHALLQNRPFLMMKGTILGISLILLRGQSINMSQKDNRVLDPLL